jgi:hypothetical protein
MIILRLVSEDPPLPRSPPELHSSWIVGPDLDERKMIPFDGLDTALLYIYIETTILLAWKAHKYT